MFHFLEYVCKNNAMAFSSHHEDHFQNLRDTNQTSLLAFQMYHLFWSDTYR